MLQLVAKLLETVRWYKTTSAACVVLFLEVGASAVQQQAQPLQQVLPVTCVLSVSCTDLRVAAAASYCAKPHCLLILRRHYG